MIATLCVVPDTINTRYPTPPIPGRVYASVWDCARTMAREEGLGVFTRGWLPFFARMLPFMAGTMPAYEQVRRALGLYYLD